MNKEQAQRIGLLAVREGMPCTEGLMCGDARNSFRLSSNDCIAGWGSSWPDVRDRNTDKTFELWAEDVAVGFFGPTVCVVFTRKGNGMFNAAVMCSELNAPDVWIDRTDHPTRAHAATALVIAMKNEVFLEQYGD